MTAPGGWGLSFPTPHPLWLWGILGPERARLRPAGLREERPMLWKLVVVSRSGGRQGTPAFLASCCSVSSPRPHCWASRPGAVPKSAVVARLLACIGDRCVDEHFRESPEGFLWVGRNGRAEKRGVRVFLPRGLFPSPPSLSFG